MHDEDVLTYPCVICGAEAGENCRDEVDPAVVLADGVIHVGRFTCGGPMLIQKDEDGDWRQIDN